MAGDLSMMFSRMIGTLAVILIISAFIGSSDIIEKYVKSKKHWGFTVITGLLGGVFGIYGNISGFDFRGAVISVRDMGPMLAGFIGGPVGGVIAGLICGVHRLWMGGITAPACVVATCCIGLICGFVSLKWHMYIVKPLVAFLLSALMEVFHLVVVLIMVKPFDTAMGIVGQIAVPFVTVNALGFALMIVIMNYTEKQRNLTIERSRLQSELDVANVIQHSLLPLINDTYPGCKDLEVSASMEAAKTVGGDFYDVFFVSSDRICFVIGDVSGKGVPAALFMASSKFILQNCIRDNADLAQAVETANRALCARNEAGMFVTVWVGILDIKSGDLTYVSAGHNPPVILRDNKPEFLKGKSGFVLAGMEDMKYRENKYRLEPGDVLYLYTDGVTEADDREHYLFGDARLLKCFENKSGSTPSAIIDTVKANVEDFIDGNDQFDDITMLCFKWKKD